MNVEVKVITGAKRQEISVEGSRLKVRLLAKPVKGKANEELIALVAETFKVRRQEVRIVAGERDRRKVLSIPLERDAFDRVLESRREAAEGEGFPR